MFQMLKFTAMYAFEDVVLTFTHRCYVCRAKRSLDFGLVAVDKIYLMYVRVEVKTTF
jgi:hypothetical protein